MDSNLLRRLYHDMLRIRMVEERIAVKYAEQAMRCPVHLCVGQEAVAAGVCANLTHGDYVVSGHRSHGHFLAKGGDLKAMVAELYGKVTGCSLGKGGSMHLVDLKVGFLGAAPIVGSTIPIGVGAAFGSTMRGEARVTVVFLGEGATEEGVFHESLNFAALRQLPVVFVCENNLYSVYSPLSVRQPQGREVFEMVKGHGVDSRHGDGNNVVEVYKLTQEAVRRARDGGGPSFLEFGTYRWREHCGPQYDNELGYRTEAELDEWKQRDPVATTRSQLLTEGILSKRDVERITACLEAEIEECFEFAESSPFPEPELLLEHLFAPDREAGVAA